MGRRNGLKIHWWQHRPGSSPGGRTKKKKVCILLNNLTGKRSGKLLILHPTTKRDTNKSIIWECLCDCGTITYVSARNLRNEKNKIMWMYS